MRAALGARGAGRAGSPCEPETTCRRTALSGSSRLQFPGNVDKAGEYCGELANRAYGKTVWSWPSSLRSSFSRRCQRAQPGGRHRLFAGRGRPEGIRLPGEHGISRQTTAQGRPSDWHHLYAAVRFSCATSSRSGPRVRGQHPVFPAPSWRGGLSHQAKLGRNPSRGYGAVSAPKCMLAGRPLLRHFWGRPGNPESFRSVVFSSRSAPRVHRRRRDPIGPRGSHRLYRVLFAPAPMPSR